MAFSAARLAADSLRVLPRKRISRALGSLADIAGGRAMVDGAVSAFVRVYDVDMSEAIVPEGGFRSFNDFFTRRLKPGARPLDPDPRAVLSPADGRVDDLGPISEDARLEIKGHVYTVGELLGDEQAAQGYRGGAYFVVYLSPRDYHRVHAPVTGDVVELRHVPGTLFPVNSIGTDHVPGLFAKNERVAMVQRSELHGEVTTVMVGAIGVGRISVTFDDIVTNQGMQAGLRRYGDVAPPMERGEELGVFHLGSTAIVFVPPEAKVIPERRAGDFTRMGEALARGGLE